MKDSVKPFDMEERLVIFAGDVILFTKKLTRDVASQYLGE